MQIFAAKLQKAKSVKTVVFMTCAQYFKTYEAIKYMYVRKRPKAVFN